MSQALFQVDAFADQVFSGNPAAVMPLQDWLDDAVLQSLAMENNLSETAFLVAAAQGYELRWFTPAVEVDLCGHATLACAHVLFEHLDYPGNEILFYTRSGELRVQRSSAGLTLDFPATELESTSVDMAVSDALGAIASEMVLAGRDGGMLLCVFEFEQDVARLAPDFPALLAATDRPVIVTAPGDECDFVSRFFGPQVGIDEDPVTGSAHCCLTSYWAPRLQRNRLTARQISARVGELVCELQGDRVLLSGNAVTYLTGTVHRID